MNMNICISVRFCNLFVVNFRQPVVCCNSTGIAQDQTTDRISDGRILLNTPVLYFYITVHYIFVIQNGRLHGTHLFTLLAIKNIRLSYLLITCLSQHTLHTVLYIFNVDFTLYQLGLKICCYTQSKQIYNIIIVCHLCCIERFHNGIINFGQSEISSGAISFDYLEHLSTSPWF